MASRRRAETFEVSVGYLKVMGRQLGRDREEGLGQTREATKQSKRLMAHGGKIRSDDNIDPHGGKVVADQLIGERLSHVLAKGQALLSQHVTQTIFGPGIDYGPFMAWHSQSLTLLRAYFGSSHTYVASFETATTFSGRPDASPPYVEQGLGVLQAAAEDISMGWTWQFKELVHADVFTDFLDMADYLLIDGGFKDPAAVLAGSVLEEHLRKLCQKNNIPTQVQGSRGTEPKKASVMNDELSKQQAYNQAEWRSVQAWLDHRNDAAHGDYLKYDNKQIKLMIDGIRDFFVRHPA